MWTRFQWHRQRRAKIALLLLPALLYRAAIPVGFMPMVEDGRLTVVVCPGEVTIRMISGAPAAHHHSGHAEKAEPTSAQHQPCPFAASAGSAPPPVVLTVASPAPDADLVAVHVAAQVFSPAVVRAQTARAPPPSPNY